MKVCFVLRKRLDLTQIELGIRVGVSQGEISNLETGYKIRRMSEIAQLLGCEADDLLLEWDDYRDRERQLELNLELAEKAS